jgi:hypothetical protein
MRCQFLGLLALASLYLACTPIPKPLPNSISTHEMGFDPYGQDCAGGISVLISDATDSSQIGQWVYIKPALERHRLPNGFISSGNNRLQLFGRLEQGQCVHLMGDASTPQAALFFVYDSVYVYCPYQFFELETMQRSPQNRGQPLFLQQRIRIVE